jgi:hypothetical protein
LPTAVQQLTQRNSKYKQPASQAQSLKTDSCETSIPSGREPITAHPSAPNKDDSSDPRNSHLSDKEAIVDESAKIFKHFEHWNTDNATDMQQVHKIL